MIYLIQIIKSVETDDHNSFCFFRQDCSSCLMRSFSFSLWRGLMMSAQHLKPTPSTNVTRLLPETVQSHRASQGIKLSTAPVETKVKSEAFCRFSLKWDENVPAFVSSTQCQSNVQFYTFLFYISHG